MEEAILASIDGGRYRAHVHICPSRASTGGGQGRHQGPCLEGALLFDHGMGVEVVVDPDRVVARVFDQPGELDDVAHCASTGIPSRSPFHPCARMSKRISPVSSPARS